MRLAPAAELAIRGALVLAEHFGEGPITLRKVCEIRDLPKEYLTKIFSTLARNGLVSPIRGKHGGYVLTRSPDDISLLEIIEAVEGPIALNFCQQIPSQCDNERCHIRPVWAELQRTVRGKLASVTLADGVNDTGGEA